ncbi:Cerato-platanin-domain-containing protein [Delitschia confertaspora ATCC 74209]|uniref:Cerato-platanin-domain-containing protein n=1 Tax=Delitschia confertaspora ATCC 74209 TaxID=1513339 RepID=A0A9P4JAP6_9PLEO|nr:Cerato-platanin-domain-containing protein [Delitschia confertaspora ATCC 74209]
MVCTGLLSTTATLFYVSQAIQVTYDSGYDNSTRSLDVVSCSNGPNGLMTKYGWQTQGNIVNFPYIGGYSGVAGWNSPQCGTCLTPTFAGRSINILVIDSAMTDFNIALSAMNDLTGGYSIQFGTVDAIAAQVDSSQCGSRAASSGKAVVLRRPPVLRRVPAQVRRSRL